MQLDQSMIEKRIGQYTLGKPNSCPRADLALIADNYRKNITQRFISKREDEIAQIHGDNNIVSIKVDGMFSVFFYKAGEYSFFTNSPTHRMFIGLPVQADLEEKLAAKGITEAIIPGELFAVPDPSAPFTTRTRVYDFVHISQLPRNEIELGRIGFRAFDVISLNGRNLLDEYYEKRLAELKPIFNTTDRAGMIITEVVNSSQGIAHFYREHVTQGGHEGVVVRAGGLGFKIKPVHSVDVVIIGVAAGRSGSRLRDDQVASTLVALRHPDGTYQVLTSAGGGLSDTDRSALWQRMNFAECLNFTSRTSDGRAFRMVKPELVGQLEYLDVITEAHGEPIMQNVLTFDEATNTWKSIGTTPFVSLISPRYLPSAPIRDDKYPTIDDVRATQITNLVDLTRATVSTQPDTPSRILARAVFTKGTTAVKKFMAWETNKSTYPTYVVYMLDYSDGRAKPIQRTVKVTNSPEQLWVIYNGLVTEEMIGSDGSSLKRGWAKVSDVRV